MGFFESADPAQRQEDDLRQIVALLTQIRDMLQEALKAGGNNNQAM